MTEKKMLFPREIGRRKKIRARGVKIRCKPIMGFFVLSTCKVSSFRLWNSLRGYPKIPQWFLC
jgi:hypothetical protein